MENSVISLGNVTKDFGGGVLGLDDVTLDVPEGEITVLLGLSGSGKSTLLRHLNGLHKPTTGEVNVLGKDLSTLKSKEMRALRKDIGVIFQHFNLIGPMSVLENVCTGRLGSLNGPRLSLMTYPKDVRSEAIEQLERVGLGDRAFQRADTLSGGQQQRVAIARALMQHPKVLLADEPVASLDPVSSKGVMELLTEISQEEKLTVVCSLHQAQLAVDFGDRIIGLRSGQVVLDQDTSSMTVEDANAIYSAVAGAEEETATEMSA